MLTLPNIKHIGTAHDKMPCCLNSVSWLRLYILARWTNTRRRHKISFSTEINLAFFIISVNNYRFGSWLQFSFIKAMISLCRKEKIKSQRSIVFWRKENSTQYIEFAYFTNSHSALSTAHLNLKEHLKSGRIYCYVLFLTMVNKCSYWARGVGAFSQAWLKKTVDVHNTTVC